MNAPATWHAGERALQARAGSADALADIGPRIVRREMPQQHRDFFAQLPFVALGAADAQGQPWATQLSGAPGFVQAPTPQRLDIAALPAPDDPLHGLLRPGHAVALLGIELPTRRRNRANGEIGRADAHGFTLQVRQSFGNCPQYIQRRDVAGPPAAGNGATAIEGSRLQGRAAAIVGAADTFFIASQAPAPDDGGGADVSHRGGKPGFVRVDHDGARLTWPDFAGNRFFNTLGNLAVDPRAGLLFVDFENGDMLHLAGDAELLWQGTELAAFAGAQRLVRLHVRQWRLRPGAWPLRGTLREVSPTLQRTGDWPR